ncbi:hypothetical protein, partial [Ralstonia pseudosolanacearum]
MSPTMVWSGCTGFKPFVRSPGRQQRSIMASARHETQAGRRAQSGCQLHHAMQEQQHRAGPDDGQADLL